MRLRCFDRTGTGMVVRVGARGKSDNGLGSGCGSATGSEWRGTVWEIDVRQGVVAECGRLDVTDPERGVV